MALSVSPTNGARYAERHWAFRRTATQVQDPREDRVDDLMQMDERVHARRLI